MIRNAYLKMITEKIEDLDREVDRLRRSAEETSAEAKTVFDHSLKTLRARSDEVRRRVEEIRSARATEWGKLKKGAEDALGDLRTAVDNAIRLIRKTGSNDR